MRKLPFVLFIILLFGCKEHKPAFVLKGRIENLQNDTMLIFSEGVKGKLDTILVKDGSFTYSLPLDTITPLTLLIEGKHTYPIYADKDLTLSLEGDAKDLSSFEVKGGTHNEDLNAFNRLIKTASKEDMIQLADSFIRKNPNSYANLYLLNKYFVQSSSPDFKTIISLIKSMNGALQDQPSIKQVSELANQQFERNKKSSPFFKIKNEKGEELTSTTYKNKYLLIHFWATWDEASMQMNQTLKQLYKKHKKDKTFSMLGISLDTDRNVWLNTIKNDTLNWEQVSELNGFDGQTVKLFNVEKLPSNVLISPQRTIIAEDLDEKELANKIEEVLKEANNKSKK